MVSVGKLSYSIYLWHWPLLVFFAAWYHEPLKMLTAGEVILILGLTVLLSWLSLTFIENPIRRKRVFATRARILLATGSAMAALAVFGVGAHFSHGFIARIPNDVLQIANGASDFGDWYQCRDKTVAQVNAVDLCRLGGAANKSKQPRFLLWGDSHAHVLAPVVDPVATEIGVPGLLAVRVACPPIPDLDLASIEWDPNCQAFNNSVFGLISDQNFDAVFLAARWSHYRNTLTVRHSDGSVGGMPDANFFERQLQRTIERLTARGITVFVFEEVPYPEDYSPARFARAVWWGADAGSAGISITDYRKRNERFSQFLDELNNSKLKRISPTHALCRDGVFCPAVVDGRSNFFDENHISTHGAAQLAPAFRAAFRQIDWN
jgi:hypothetical protein